MADESLIPFDHENQLPAEYQEQFDKDSKSNLTGVQPRLPKVQMPTGRGKLFSLEVIGDEPRDIPALRGVVIYQSPAKAYWTEAFGGGGNQVVPDCASHDGIKPSDQYANLQAELCASCKHNRFGTAKDAAGSKLPGKACRDVKRIVVLLVDDPEIPYILTIPPTGIRNFDDYLIRLRKERRPYWTVVTEITLTTDTNRSGIEFPKIVPKIHGYINNPKILDQVKNLKSEWAEMLKNTLFSNQDIATYQDTTSEPVASEMPPDSSPQEY